MFSDMYTYHFRVKSKNILLTCSCIIISVIIRLHPRLICVHITTHIYREVFRDVWFVSVCLSRGGFGGGAKNWMNFLLLPGTIAVLQSGQPQKAKNVASRAMHKEMQNVLKRRQK